MRPGSPGAAGPDTPVPALAATAPLFDGMGSHQVDDVSPNALARRYVAQGLVLAWGFNPAEAARSFAGAAAVDPQCAAAWWGRAWAPGPTINSDLDLADAATVHEALGRARALAATATPRWRGLIDALAARHPEPGTVRVDEVAYEARLSALAARHPRDADLATLAAEALMNLHPYDWWQPDGRPQPWTAMVARRLEQALALNPGHPGANHAWVHLMERSPTPARARAAAGRLRSLVPGSGHLLHMPAHIDMRLGDYAAAVAANQRAIAADERYLAQVDAQGAYRVGYVAHNHHFLWAAAAMQGASALAIAAAGAAFPAACGPRRPVRAGGTLQLFAALPFYAGVRFGRWQELLTGMRPPDGDEPFPRAIWHYARGTALLRLGRRAEAGDELDRLAALLGDPELGTTRVKQVHQATALVNIARLTLGADLAMADGRSDGGLAALREAVAIEDGLEADEPHLWLAPTRHALGAALLQAGRPAAAVQVFAEDLRHYPDNGWALAGLMQAEQARGRRVEAAALAARLGAAWRAADVGPPRPRY